MIQFYLAWAYAFGYSTECDNGLTQFCNYYSMQDALSSGYLDFACMKAVSNVAPVGEAFRYIHDTQSEDFFLRWIWYWARNIFVKYKKFLILVCMRTMARTSMPHWLGHISQVWFTMLPCSTPVWVATLWPWDWHLTLSECCRRQLTSPGHRETGWCHQTVVSVSVDVVNIILEDIINVLYINSEIVQMYYMYLCINNWHLKKDQEQTNNQKKWNS